MSLHIFRCGMDYIFIQQVPNGFTFGRVHATSDRSYFPDAFESEMLSLFHQMKNIAELEKIDLLLGLERVSLEEAHDLPKVLKLPNSQFPAILVVLADSAATKEPFETVQHWQIAQMLNDAEFRDNLIACASPWIALDAYEEAAFAVHKTNHPFRVELHTFDFLLDTWRVVSEERICMLSCGLSNRNHFYARAGARS